MGRGISSMAEFAGGNGGAYYAGVAGGLYRIQLTRFWPAGAGGGHMLCDYNRQQISHWNGQLGGSGDIFYWRDFTAYRDFCSSRLRSSRDFRNNIHIGGLIRNARQESAGQGAVA